MNGWSPVETALAFLPAGLLVAVGSPRIGPLVDRFGTARVIAAGAAVVASPATRSSCASTRRPTTSRCSCPRCC